MVVGVAGIDMLNNNKSKLNIESLNFKILYFKISLGIKPCAYSFSSQNQKS